MDLEQIDKELLKIKDISTEYQEFGTRNFDDWKVLLERTIDITEDLIEYSHRRDPKVELFKEWMVEYFQFYKDNGSISTVHLVNNIEKKFNEIFE